MFPTSAKQRKARKQAAARRLRQLRASRCRASTPDSDGQSADTEFEGDLDTTSDTPTPVENQSSTPIPDNSQSTDHSLSFRDFTFGESQEIPETDLVKFMSSDAELYVNNKFLPAKGNTAESSSDLADCEDFGPDWDSPLGSFNDLSPLFEGEEDLGFGFSDPIW